MSLDPYRDAENWVDCPRCGNAFGWNDEDYLEGQECHCGHVFDGSEAPEIEQALHTRIEHGPRQRPSGLAERALERAS
jgi:hypothetical protein